MGVRVWSGGEIFSKKIKTLWGGHIRPPPPIITKVKIRGVNKHIIIRERKKKRHIKGILSQRLTLVLLF